VRRIIGVLGAVIEGADTFDVVVTGFEPGDETPVSRLQRVFGIGGVAAERLLARLPAPVQRGVPRVRAEYFRRALLKIGAHVEVRSPEGLLMEAVASVPPPAPHRLSERPSSISPEPAPAPAPSSAPPPPRIAAPTAIAVPAPQLPPREPRLWLDDDDGVALDPSLRPEALKPELPLLLDIPATPFGSGGATADTMIDSRQRPHATPQAQPRPSAPLDAPALAHDTLADAVRVPANPTLREGFKAAAPVPSDAAPRAGATMVQGNAAPVLAGAPASNGFRPPPLELGLDGADMMTKLPSSVWDAPVQAGATQLQTAPRHTGDIELPGASAVSLDLGELANRPAVEEPLELPSMPAPARGRAPLSQARPQNPRERPQREAPRASVGKVGATKITTKGAEGAVREAVPFWQSASQAFALPFAGTGAAWLGLIVLWALAAALLSAASMLVVVLGVIVAFSAYTTLLALACDYFRACFWVADEGGSVLERGPSLAPLRILHTYLKSGAHLMVFALAAGLPLIFVAIAGMGEGATPLELLEEPTTWLLALIPALLWPGAVAMTALENRYEAIWQLARALGVAARAPLEYLAVAGAGALIFGAGLWLLLALASAAGISGVLLSAVLGPPMALSHGIQGALMGYLMRARPELFR